MILTDESIVYQSHSKNEKNVEAQSFSFNTTGDPATERRKMAGPDEGFSCGTRPLPDRIHP